MSELITTISSKEYRDLVVDAVKRADAAASLFSEQLAHGATRIKLADAEREIERLKDGMKLLEGYVNEFSYRKTQFEKYCIEHSTAEEEPIDEETTEDDHE